MLICEKISLYIDESRLSKLVKVSQPQKFDHKFPNTKLDSEVTTFQSWELLDLCVHMKSWDPTVCWLQGLSEATV